MGVRDPPEVILNPGPSPCHPTTLCVSSQHRARWAGPPWGLGTPPRSSPPGGPCGGPPGGPASPPSAGPAGRSAPATIPPGREDAAALSSASLQVGWVLPSRGHRGDLSRPWGARLYPSNGTQGDQPLWFKHPPKRMGFIFFCWEMRYSLKWPATSPPTVKIHRNLHIRRSVNKLAQHLRYSESFFFEISPPIISTIAHRVTMHSEPDASKHKPFIL